VSDRFAAWFETWLERNPLAAIPLTIAFLGALFVPMLVYGVGDWSKSSHPWWFACGGVAWAAVLVAGFRWRPSALWALGAVPVCAGLPSRFTGRSRPDVELVVAAFIVAAIPPLAAYLVLQRYRSWKTGVAWDGSVDGAREIQATLERRRAKAARRREKGARRRPADL
jgi:hypothetical protein